MAHQAQFIDHTAIEWQRVKRTSYVCHQRFRYEYPGPIRDLRQQLVVIPARRYGDQRLRNHRLTVSPHAAATRSRTDGFGNRVLEVDVPHIDRAIDFEVSTTVERTASPLPPPRVTRAQGEHFL